ncbi:LYAR-type C2HC zinc finger protein [Colletotrichum tofieldiae]|uniref:LYAR-type C2HC zinc finger protein n=1 Tax=Colletotrichum tofieldiae TaxID=708197 RepID=A0A166QQ70_9PEZI|nr:LYAR-type C2HC zinc finger protein [Colletotrichum tofieldiae]GKT75499.1 LYAR-type C2HC zinc finger protein [Colletotrichum tofieldiae]
MVSFSCESCGDVLTKKKLDPHRNRCRGATFTCIDCMVYFPGTEYRSHTSCMSEAQKYQGALYKEKNNNKKNKTNNNQPQPAPVHQYDAMAQHAYVEEVPDAEFESFPYEASDNGNSPAELLPEAPTPPSANEGNINVFDFLDASATPNASALGAKGATEETQLVRYEYEAEAYLDDEGAMVDEDRRALVQYGTGPIPMGFETPAPKHERRRKDGSEKKDKKRKRLHVDTDQMMVDAPPTLAHSGLTGGLKTMMRPVFPPSPDYSGGDVADPGPNSPLKKSKSSKHKKEGGIGNNLLGLLSMNSTKTKTKTKKRKVSSSTKKHSHHHHRSDGEKAPKLIEYRPGSRDSKKGEDGDDEGQMIVYRPRADLFLSFINKGPHSERGCSMNKALKRFHRERSSSEDSLGKLSEEKELWRSLRMRRNDRGEIVLFTA